MSRTLRLRGSSAWLGVALIAVLLPIAGPAGPAAAADCANEVPVVLPPSACDDATPPETTLEPMSPAPNAAGWTKTDTVTFTFAAVNTDPADTDEMRVECKLEGPSTQAHDWQDCTSATSQQYADLEDTPAGEEYTFSVRAYDSVDRPWDYDDPATPFDNEDEVADEDATPETVSWKQDTVKPVALLFGGPKDPQGTGWPILKQPRTSFLVDATEENVDYRCQLDGVNKACDAGRLVLKNLKGGNRTLTLSVTDRAGNVSDAPATEQFVVPYNLTKAAGWSKRRGKGYFGHDYLQTRTTGARIKFKATNVNEFYFLAPSGPKLGSLRVRIGTVWRTYDLSAKKATSSRKYLVRGDGFLVYSGPIVIESLSRGKPVRIDALVFPVV